MVIGFRPSVDSLGGISDMSPGVPVDQMASTTPFANVPLDKEDRNTLAFREQFVGEPRRQIERLTEQTSQLPMLEKQSEAERTARQAQRGAAALRQERKAIEESDAFKNLKQLEKQTMMSEFVPTKENAQDLSNLFGLVSLIGFTIGMGGKRHAMQAMSAMNGMLEGHRAGREDLYKREKSIFEEQMKTLKQKTEILTKELERIAKLAATDRAAAEEDATALFAQEGADFYKKHAEKYGALGTLELAKANLQNAEKSFEIILKEREKRDARLDKIAQQMQMFQLKSAHDFELARLRAALNPPKGGGKGSATSQQFENITAADVGNAWFRINQWLSRAKSVDDIPSGSPFLRDRGTQSGIVDAFLNYAKTSSLPADMQATDAALLGIAFDIVAARAQGRATGVTDAKIAQVVRQLPIEGDKPETKREKIALLFNQLDEVNKMLPDEKQKAGGDYMRSPVARQIWQKYSGEETSAPQGPQPGEVKGGYRFKGGNPADKNNWEKVSG